MAAAVAAQSPDTTITHKSSGSGLVAADKNNMKSPHISSTTSQVHTPPETDETSHSHKDDDAVSSSSSLSDLDDDELNIEGVTVDVEGLGLRIDEQQQQHDLEAETDTKFEEAARAGAEAEKFSEVRPHHFEGGVPVFRPVCVEICS